MFELSISRRLACAALAAASLTGVAHADPRTSPIRTSGDAAGQAASPTPKHETRYCVDGPQTGTILPHRECRTRAEWLKTGVDPLAKP